MDSLELLQQIFNLCIVPLLGILCTYLVKFIETKSKEAIVNTDNEYLQKYLSMLTDTVITCVIATNQTYVNALKDKDAFDAEAQKEAFKMTYEAVVTILSEEAQNYLSNAVGDLQKYITELIEAEVSNQKLLV